MRADGASGAAKARLWNDDPEVAEIEPVGGNCREACEGGPRKEGSSELTYGVMGSFRRW
jgi:hypothetical protein